MNAALIAVFWVLGIYGVLFIIWLIFELFGGTIAVFFFWLLYISPTAFAIIGLATGNTTLSFLSEVIVIIISFLLVMGSPSSNDLRINWAILLIPTITNLLTALILNSPVIAVILTIIALSQLGGVFSARR